MRRYFRYYIREYRRFQPGGLSVEFSDLDPVEFLKSREWHWQIPDTIDKGRILPMDNKIELVHEIDEISFHNETKYSIPLLEFRFPDLANI